MNAVYVIILGFLIAFIGYRLYSKYVDAKIIQADAKRATPAKMYMDGVEFMPTSKNVLYGYQFKSIAGAAPIIGPILALQWGWLPALIWVLAGTLFIGRRLWPRWRSQKAEDQPHPRVTDDRFAVMVLERDGSFAPGRFRSLSASLHPEEVIEGWRVL